MKHQTPTIGLLVWVLNFLPLLAFAQVAQNSWPHLPMANGFSALHFNAQKLEIDSFYPHIYGAPAPELKTENLIKRAGFAVQLPKGNLALRKLPRKQLGFIPGTGIVRLVQEAYGFKVNSYYFAPMTIPARSLIAIIEVTNADKYDLQPENLRFDFQLSTDARFERLQLTSTSDSSIWRAEIFIYAPDASPDLMLELKKRFKDGLPERVLDAEQRWWESWHMDSEIPRSILGDEYLLTRQSSAFIKMAQCQEPGSAYGQIVAALPPSENRYCWPADAAYAIAALAQLKHLAEANAALKFILTAEAGLYPNLLTLAEKNTQPLQKYQVSLAGYYGNGREMAVRAGSGQILRLDGFGLVLWALEVYLKNGGDPDLLAAYWPIINSGIIDVLIEAIDATGLVRSDSGPYNLPTPGEHFTHTSATAILGLRSAGFLAFMRKDEKMMIYFMDIAEQIRQTLLKQLIDEKTQVLRSSLENKKYPDYVDLATVECLNWGLVESNWVTVRETWKEFDKRLLLGHGHGGYRSYFAKSWNSRQETTFGNLRMAAAFYAMKKKERGDVLLKWILSQSRANYDLIPQFYEAGSRNYAGSVPTIGRGAAAWILAILSK